MFSLGGCWGWQPHGGILQGVQSLGLGNKIGDSVYIIYLLHHNFPWYLSYPPLLLGLKMSGFGVLHHNSSIYVY